MVYSIAICDDNMKDSDYIGLIISKWADLRGYMIKVKTFSSAEALLFHYEEDKSYDIMLLDIEMGGMNGIELAKKIRRDNKQVQLVFITGYMEYISDGYEVEALHYLSKPVNEEKLYDVLDRAVEKLARNERTLFIKLQGEIICIPLYEIAYVEVQRNYVTIHANEPVIVKKTLGEMEKELDEGFFRIGRSFIVNLRFINRITRNEVHLKNGDIIPLPRGQYDALNRAIISYF